MKDISKLAFEIATVINKKIIPNLMMAQRETTKKVWEDTVESAPVVRGDYVSSIQIGDTEYDGKVIKTTVFSDLKVGGNNPRWAKVLLANFVNWGTGPLGENTNEYPHVYPYTTDAPWNAQTQLQYLETGTWGMKATPHFYDSLQKNIREYKKSIKECFK